jgi:hypothetical protein
MRGNIHDDLCDRKNWNFATEKVFRDEFDNDDLIHTGRFFIQLTRWIFICLTRLDREVTAHLLDGSRLMLFKSIIQSTIGLIRKLKLFI